MMEMEYSKVEVTQQGVTKLADPRLGAAIKSFRSREESKSKLPLVFWE